MVDDADGLRRRPPETGKEAQRRGMSRLRRALAKRNEHAQQAQAWRDIDTRNHFGPSIEAAMGLGRNDDR